MQAHLVTVSYPSFLAISSLSAFFAPLFGLQRVIFHTYFATVLLPSSLIYRDRKNPLYPHLCFFSFWTPNLSPDHSACSFLALLVKSGANA